MQWNGAHITIRIRSRPSVSSFQLVHEGLPLRVCGGKLRLECISVYYMSMCTSHTLYAPIVNARP